MPVATTAASVPNCVGSRCCGMTICWYLNHTEFRTLDTRSTVIRHPPLKLYPRLAKKKIPTSQVDMEMFLERSRPEPWSCSARLPFTEVDHTSCPAKGKITDT